MDDPTPPTPAQEILRIARPWALAFSLLTFALGTGIARYLGEPVTPAVYAAGQTAALLLLASAFFLQAMHERPLDIDNPRYPDEPPKLMRSHLLLIAAAGLAVAVMLLILLRAQGAMTPGAWSIFGLAFLLAMAWALPPLRFSRTAYGDLTLAVLLANLIPAAAFLLFHGDLHRLLGFLTFPLTLLTLAAALAFRLPDYAADIRVDRKNMLTQLGWQPGINLHNILILTGFLTLGATMLAGMPWALAWPGLLGLPVGVFQIAQMQSIAAGNPPRWRLLRITASLTVALTTYFLVLGLWSG